MLVCLLEVLFGLLIVVHHSVTDGAASIVERSWFHLDGQREIVDVFSGIRQNVVLVVSGFVK
jgi:hypothetical protein